MRIGARDCLLKPKEGIAFAFILDGSGRTVTGNDDGVAREGEKFLVDRLKNLFVGAAGKIGSPDAALEESVTGEKLLLGGDEDANAALGMAGGMDDGAFEGPEVDGVAVGEASIDDDAARIAHPEPLCLNVEHFEKRVVVLVEEDGSSGEVLELHRTTDVIDVGVGYDDLSKAELVLFQDRENGFDVVAGIENDGFPGGLVPQDGAIAL
jgi:hypothetical protein